MKKKKPKFLQQCSEQNCSKLIMLLFGSRPQWVWLCAVYQATIVVRNMVFVHWFMYAFCLVNGIQPIPSLKLLRWIIIQFSAGNVCGTQHNHHQNALHTYTTMYYSVYSWIIDSDQEFALRQLSSSQLSFLVLFLSQNEYAFVHLICSSVFIISFMLMHNAMLWLWHSIPHSLVNGC